MNFSFKNLGICCSFLDSTMHPAMWVCPQSCNMHGVVSQWFEFGRLHEQLSQWRKTPMLCHFEDCPLLPARPKGANYVYRNITLCAWKNCVKVKAKVIFPRIVGSSATKNPWFEFDLQGLEQAQSFLDLHLRPGMKSGLHQECKCRPMQNCHSFCIVFIRI